MRIAGHQHPLRAALLVAALALASSACSGGASSAGGTSGGGTSGGGGGGGTSGGAGTYGGGSGQPPARTVEATNPSNALLDTDCDGISDADELTLTYVDARGVARTTDPANPDSDGDGIPDGVEVGRTQVIEPSRCAAYFQPDLGPSTTTNPVVADTDGDGVADGVEDANHDGRVDPGESDPADPRDQGNPIVAAACSTSNLAPVTFDRSQPADVQTATRGFVGTSVSSPGTALADGKGWLYWDAVDQIAGFALRWPATGATASDEETAGRALLAGIGGTGTLSNPLVQTFTTWDAYPGVRATYQWSASGDAKALANAVATAFVGGTVKGLWSDTAGVTGPWVLQVEYVRRSAGSSAVIGAFIPKALYSGEGSLRVDDVANGSALAQADATASDRCDQFETAPYSKLDLLWVVDNSGSMAAHQNAVKNAGDAIAQVLQSSTLDWRMGLVTTTYYSTSAVASRDLKDFTTDIAVVKSWFDSTSAQWVNTNGSGTEEGFASAKKALDGHFLPAQAGTASRLRPDATLMVIVLTDTQEQSATAAADWVTYFKGLGAQVDAIVCQGPGACSTSETVSTKYISVTNALGGVLASIADFDANTNTVATLDAMVRSAAGATSRYQLAKPPISSSLKVALEGPTLGTCGGGTTNIADVPRSRTDGFDYYAPANSIVFYGACRPVPPAQGATGSRIALSYRYWNAGICGPDGCPFGCNPACSPRQYCDPTNTCVCYADCGGCPPGNQCDASSCSCVPIPM